MNRSIWLAGIAAILPVSVLAVSIPAEFSSPRTGFSPPQDAMLLTRIVTRSLPGGSQLVVSRTYEVRFVPDADGFRVDGQLVDCTVDAPTHLASLAEIERKRADNGLFPMSLDGAGRILTGSRPKGGQSFKLAASAFTSEVNQRVASPGDRQQALAFVRQVEAQAAGSQWPADLFYPATARKTEDRVIPLGDGTEGQVTIDQEASLAAPGRIFSRFARIVTTRLEGTTRVMREEWSLAPKS